jgi:hypothetical protein
VHGVMAILPPAEPLPFVNPAAPCGPAHSTATSAASRLVSAILQMNSRAPALVRSPALGNKPFSRAVLVIRSAGKPALQRLVRRYGPAG